jgi:DNA repair exonuclease
VVRFIHAADIHLDSPLKGLARYEGAPVEQLRNATRNAFSALVTRAIEEQVDFVVIAGDLYDGDWRDYNTGLFFCREMGRLHEAGIPVYVLYGNHDAQSEITRQLRLPGNVHEFPGKAPGSFVLEHAGVALHGQSFRTAAVHENLAVGYPAAIPGFFNIGVLHTALDGHAAHDPYAPCSLDELAARGYDYWALGHVHEHAIRRTAPWVVYPGNLQGRHIRETGERGAVLVSVDGSRVKVERLAVDVLRWHHLEIDGAGAVCLEDVLEAIHRGLAGILPRNEGRAAAVRVTVRGSCRAHGELFGLENQLRAEVLAQANALAGADLWVEKVCVETSPALSPEELMARSDALADLQDLLAHVGGDAELIEGLTEELQELIGKCPREVLERVPALEAVRTGRVRELVDSVAPSLLARLACERVAERGPASRGD